MPSPQTDSDEIVESSNEPDYSAVELPSKERTEYSYVQRRAELLQLIEEAGHPDLLNQTQLAERYDVSQQQISKDFDRLASHIHARLIDRDRRAFFVDSVVRRSIRGLVDEEDWRAAAKTAMEYDDWITEFHDIQELQSRIEQIENQQNSL
jgi:hypothetical protein